MENPFTNGQVKNYLLFYASIVVIMILFFLATTLFHDVQIKEKKKFNKEIKSINVVEDTKNIKEKRRFKLMEY